MTDEIIENTADTVASSSGDVVVVDGTTVNADAVSLDAPIAPPPQQPSDAEIQFQLPDRPVDATDPDWFNQLADNHQYLHAAIAAIAPIDGISGGAQDIRAYQISFKPEATEEQRALAYARLLELPVILKQQRAREAALAAVDTWFNEQIAAGFTGPNNLKLGLKSEDITLLTGNFIMSQQALAFSLPLPPIVDMNGLAHFFANIEELTQIMLAYGQHRSNLALLYAARKAAIEAEFFAPLEPLPEVNQDPALVEQADIATSSDVFVDNSSSAADDAAPTA